MFCMQLIKWISASEDCGWCAGKTVPALVSGHINLMAGTLFSWTENPPSPLGLLKIECCWDNTLSESPWVWFPAGSSPPVRTCSLNDSCESVCGCCLLEERVAAVECACVVYLWVLFRNMLQWLLCLHSSPSPWWDTTCLWTLCIFTTSSTGPCQVLLCIAAVPGCCLCTGGGTGGAVAICHHRHLQGLASSRAGCLFWAPDAGECIIACCHFSFLLLCHPLAFPQFHDPFFHMCFAFRKLWGV